MVRHYKDIFQVMKYTDIIDNCPLCETEGGKCHGECPYYSECYSDYDDEDEEDGGRA